MNSALLVVGLNTFIPDVCITTVTVHYNTTCYSTTSKGHSFIVSK